MAEIDVDALNSAWSKESNSTSFFFIGHTAQNLDA